MRLLPNAAFLLTFTSCAYLFNTPEEKVCIAPPHVASIANGPDAMLIFCQENPDTNKWQFNCSYAYLDEHEQLCYHILLQEGSCYVGWQYIGTVCHEDKETSYPSSIDYTDPWNFHPEWDEWRSRRI